MKRSREGISWEDHLDYDHKGNRLSTTENLRLILLNDPFLKGRFGQNCFDGRRWLRQAPPWNAQRPWYGPRLWDDGDDAGLRWHLESYWGVTGRSAVADALELAAREQTFHPVKDYLENLYWDGVERLDTMLIDYLQAEDTPFVRAVSRKWMVAGCKRIFEPGCKFDTMLVLISPGQGRGKSLLGDILAGEWFKDGLRDITGKDALQELQGKWIVELGELSGLKKAENETVKQFLSCRKDTYRPSYGRYALDFPRQCIFLGSTNDREFITDETGGRRFWPVEIHGSAETTTERMEGLRIVRDLLWAEAMERYRQGEKTWLSTAEEIAAGESEQQRFAQQDEWVGLVRAYLERTLPRDWEKMPPEARRAFICSGEKGEIPRRRVSIAEIRYELLGEEMKGANASSRRLGKIMNVMEDWKAVGVRETVFGKQKVYDRRWTGFAANNGQTQQL